MEKTVERHAVDVDPQRARPGLALVLALLSIPGSTIAWELPGGGFWIGLPLAIAALALAIGARRQLGSSGMAVAAIVIALAMIGMMVVWTIASLL